MKLYIIRGVSGAGKSTIAKNLTSLYLSLGIPALNIEADHFFYDAHGYNFDANKISVAHQQCQSRCEAAMTRGDVVVLSNTTVKERDLKLYLDMAKRYGYNVTSLIVENRHGNSNVHNVPEETLQRQEQALRSSIKLR